MNKKLGNLFKGDKVIWMIFFFLCLVSVVEVFSASSFLTFKGASYWWPLLKHTSFIIAGVFAMLCLLNMPCKYFKVCTIPLLLLSFVMLIIVLFFGESTNGANRWIGIFGIQFQPSEIGKFALVLAVAQILSAMQTDDGADRDAIGFVLATSALIIVPIFFENLSTAALLAAVVFMMMVVGRVPFPQLGKLLGVCAIVAVLGIAAIMTLGDSSAAEQPATAKTAMTETTTTAAESAKPQRHGLLHRLDTWKARFTRHGQPDPKPEDYDLDRDAQEGHAQIAIVKSNIIGVGPGNSEERDFLSQAFSDFIYAIIIEEMGLAGAAVIAALYIILFWRVYHIASRCANTYPAFLAMGIGLVLVTQALFNMMVAVGIVPVTGQQLPLVSKGGTSTLINCAYIGILLSISRTAKKKPATATA